MCVSNDISDGFSPSQEADDGEVEAALDEVEVAEEERDVEEHHDVAADHLGEVDLHGRVALVAEAARRPEVQVEAGALLLQLGLGARQVFH